MSREANKKTRRKMKGPVAGKIKVKSEPVHRPPAQEISEAIIELIERQVFVPGEPLREQDLADRFDVTRGRVREALHILEARGFVQIERMKGATVSRYDHMEILAIGEIRRALMALAARRAATLGSAAAHKAILSTAQEMTTSGPDLPPQEFRKQTVKLAELICRAADSPYLKRLVDDSHRGRLYRTLTVSTRARRVQAAKNWLRVASAIDKGDGALAGRLVEKIYEQAAEAIRDAIIAGE